MTTVSLVLGSGGARGYAHIGAIEEIRRRGYDIVAISGSSMGALVGGMYAAGKLSEYRDWVSSLNWMQVLRLLDFTLSRGAIRGDRLFVKLAEILQSSPRIEDLAIPFTAIVTDITRQKEVWFQRGPLLEALRASVAIPGLFTPVERDGRLLVDGGVLNPLPIIPVVSAQADLIIAVDLNIPEGCYSTLQWPDTRFLERSGMSDDWHVPETNDTGNGKKIPFAKEAGGRLDILLNSVEVMQASLSEYKIAGYPPDLVIRVPKKICSFYEFHRAREVIEFGRLATREHLQDLERSVG